MDSSGSEPLPRNHRIFQMLEQPLDPSSHANDLLKL